jgi:hypothetical protein
VSAQTCEYRFDPSEWEREHGRPAALDTAWSCSREPEADSEFCRFHLTPDRRAELGIDDEAVCDSLCAELSDQATSSLRFVGAEFGDIDLSHEVVGQTTNRPVDFRYATVHGDFVARQTVLWQPVVMDELTVHGSVDFADAEFDEDVSVRDATFTGEVSFEKTDFEDDCVFAGSTFDEPAAFDGVTVEGLADFYETTFGAAASFVESDWQGRCRFQRGRFDAMATFRSSRFHARADFRSAAFDGPCRFSRSRFDDDALFIECAFDAPSLFKKTQFRETAYFQTSSFNSEASFTEATFGGKAKFHFADFRGEAVFSYIRFEDAAYFKRAAFGGYASFYETSFEKLADFRHTEFADTARFMQADFGNEAFFSRATFGRDADFRDASFRQKGRFVGSEFQAGAIMADATFAHAVFRDIETTKNAITIDLEGARIEAGEIVQENGAEVSFNVRDGCLGDIDIRMPETERLFDRFLIVRTEFEGFDFSEYRYVLAPDWRVHTFAGEQDGDYDLEADHFAIEAGDTESETGGESRTEDRPDQRKSGGSVGSRLRTWLVNPAAPDLEVTYLKAKHGAETVGDSQAASRFFIKEMGYRRQSHLHRVFEHAEPLVTRLKLLFLVAMNLVLSLTCGYGEKPRRTLGFSLVTIVVYAGLFWAFVPDPPFGSSAGYLLLSLQSFASLIFGASATVPGFGGSVIAATEGFVGAFMIGLFIFALTRSVHR